MLVVLNPVTMSKLTLNDLYKELGELLSVDMAEESTKLIASHREAQAAMSTKHELERKQLKLAAHRQERKEVELRKAIQLAKDGMDPTQAIMQSKGTAVEVKVGTGPDTLWIMPDEDDA